MKTFAIALLNDEAGFIVSAELVLISSVCVLAMVVGLSEVANGINQELEDIGSAFGSINQSYRYAGLSGHGGLSGGGGAFNRLSGSAGGDRIGVHRTALFGAGWGCAGRLSFT